MKELVKVCLIYKLFETTYTGKIYILPGMNFVNYYNLRSVDSVGSFNRLKGRGVNWLHFAIQV